ncbi:A-kinase anchor protein 17A-like [Dendronephthya gigantea]|uniref:A-kinase anchor protein 17A-like n=1 Tax=Dendronephthya gigantea TaxID=151771 RepID=UPI00106C0E85|nr:A-kinase anchor protein 17A-like [Dendronephthya gigantea]
MAAQVCNDTSDSIELCPARGLYLKPVTKLTILVGLPEIREVGITISNWEVMEKVKCMVAPIQFSVLRVVESSLERIQFEAEVDTKSLLSRTVAKLDGNLIKLSGLADALKVRSYEKKHKYPVKHDWEAFFRDAIELNEWKPGERPDTIHLKGLPSKWFSDEKSGNKPVKEVIVSVFEKFGKIRYLDVPSLDPYRARITKQHQPNFQTFCFGSELHFEVYIQYEDYQGFVNAMKGLKGMKLLLKSEGSKSAMATISFDFDKTCHLSETNIRKRNAERRRLIEQDRLEELKKAQEKKEQEEREKEERIKAEERAAEILRQMQENKRKKEKRRRAREERRRQKREEKRRLEKEREERQKQMLMEKERIEKLRSKQAKNVLGEVFQRINDIIVEEKETKRKREEELVLLAQIKEKKEKLEHEMRKKEDEEKMKKKQMEEDEQHLRDKLLKNLQVMKERKAELEREILRKQVQGKIKMVSVIKIDTS